MTSERTAIITGATSGIGAAYAGMLAEKGFDLFLTGRRKDKINAIARELREKYGVHVTVSIAELSDSSDVDRLIDEIASIPKIAMLINNAGFGNAGPFSEYPQQNFKMLMTHVTASVRLAAAVVPRMIESGDGVIINVASVAAFFPMPSSATYSSTKRYLVTFSESLHMELYAKGVRVQALCPGMTRTDFHERMGAAGENIKKRYFLNWMSPRKVARLSLRRLSSRRVVYIPGIVNKLLVVFGTKLPRTIYYRVVGKL